MKSERLGKYVFWGLAALYAAFIAYVSWMPVGVEDYFPNRSFFDGIERLPYLFFPHHFRDFATNILLYIPLGALVASAVAPGRPRFLGRWLVAGFFVTVVMEIGQSVFERYPDALDIITNTIGYAIGYCAVVALVRFYGFDPIALTGFRTESDHSPRLQTIAVARFIYICLYVLVAMLPFDVSVIYHEIYAQLFPDSSGHIRLILDPLYHLGGWPDGWPGLGLELLALLPVAILSAALNAVKGRVSVIDAVFPCVLVAMFCEISQVFILSRTTDVAMYAVALAAGFVGWAAVRAWLAVRGIEVDTRPAAGIASARPWVVASIGYALAVAVASLWPFNYERDHRYVASKMFSEQNRVPFLYTTSVMDVVRTTSLFVPLGYLVQFMTASVFPRSSRWKTIILSAVVCAGLSALMEYSQTICVGRYFDMTDVVLAFAGGMIGAALAGTQPARPAKTARRA
ncbi:MAG: VanZ family protein [Candidatus Latescibacterota bacterium]